MPFIHSVSCQLPENYYRQSELFEALQKEWGHRPEFKAAKGIFLNVRVEGRYLARPLEAMRKLKGLEDRNNIWSEVALALSTQAVTKLLDRAGLSPKDISLLASSTSDGMRVPTLESGLMNRIPFSPDTERMPLFGLACGGGVAGINLMAKYLKGHPTEAVIFFTVTLPTLGFRLDDFQIENLISAALFGDACAAVLMTGDKHFLAGHCPLEVIDTQNTFYPDSENLAGIAFLDGGLRTVLSPKIPAVAEKKLPQDIGRLLDANDLSKEDLGFFAGHTGATKILQCIETCLSLPENALSVSWDNLRKYGNLGSASVLYVLRDTIKNLSDKDPVLPHGLMMTLGPAFSSVLTLLKYSRSH